MVEETVKELNVENYGRIDFSLLDPAKDPNAAVESKDYHLRGLMWPAFETPQGQTIPAGQGVVGLMVRYGDETETIRLLQELRLPLVGTVYQLMGPDDLKETLSASVESVIHINEDIGYLVSHGCRELGSGYAMPGQQEKNAYTAFNELLSQDYSVVHVDLKEGAVPEGLNTLIIAGPREPFSDYELYQIDQFLMKGHNLVLFLDAFEEIMPPAEQPMFRQNQGPIYVPNDTGLQKLLGHYGLQEKAAYVLDEKCYRQKGWGGGEQSLYFAPIIQKDEINRELAVLDNIKGLIVVKAAPVSVNDEKLKESGLEAVRLFSSSAKSWEMVGRIDLNPMFMQPPVDENSMKSVSLAYMVQGSFPSYFAASPCRRSLPKKTVRQPKHRMTAPPGRTALPTWKAPRQPWKRGKAQRSFWWEPQSCCKTAFSMSVGRVRTPSSS